MQVLKVEKYGTSKYLIELLMQLKYGFKKIYFFIIEPLISCSFPSSKLDSPGIKTLERHSLDVKKVSLQCFNSRRI